MLECTKKNLHTDHLKRQTLDPFVGGGTVGYCHRNRCKIASVNYRFKFPNGLVRGRDGLIYVPSTIDGSIGVFTLTADHLLEKISTIETGLPLDNLSVDKNGDIFAAAIPQLYQWNKGSISPFNVQVPSTVLRIHKGGKGYQGEGRKGHHSSHEEGFLVEKVLEDDGKVLPGSTVVVHDVETGRYFLGGAVSPFITICEPRKK